MFGFRVTGQRVAFRIAFVLCIGISCVASGGAAPIKSPASSRPKRILTLYAFDREERIFEDFDRNLRAELANHVPGRLEFYTEDLDMVRFSSPEHARELTRLLKEKYSSIKPDLVVTISYAALDFALGEGEGPFPDAAIVVLFNARSMNLVQQAIATRHHSRGVSGIGDIEDAGKTLDLALAMQPDTSEVAVVVGCSAPEKSAISVLDSEFARFRGRLDITYMTDVSMQALVEKVGHLPPHTIVLISSFLQDAAGQFFLPDESVGLISGASSVPVYGIDATNIGHGVLGGHMVEPGNLGDRVANVGGRLLNGESAAAIPIAIDDSARDTIDWRELKRWHISEARVPQGTVELYRAPTAWEQYRIIILSAVALAMVESTLVVALILNITKLKRAERGLVREKTLADAVIEGLPGVFVLQDRTGKNVRWNKIAADMARHSLGDTRTLENIAEYDRDAALRAREEVFEKGSARAEADLLTSGDPVPYYFSALRVDLEGKPYMAVAGIDLSERKQAEAAVRRSEAQLRSFVENAPYGIGSISVTRDAFLRANPALVKLLGYKSEAELLAISVSKDLRTGGEQQKLHAQLTRADYFKGVEFTWKRSDGKPITVSASGRRLAGRHGDVLEIIVEDVTARRALEDQLRHAQKMEALGQLAGSTAHDFNNLLAVIIGHSELLAATTADSSSRSRADIIKKAGERAASLTAQLLAFSRRQVMQLKTVNLNALVLETNHMLARLMGENIEHRLELAPDLGTIKADPGQIVQVIMNLAVNARDAMPHGGALVISTSSVILANSVTIQGVAVPAGRYVVMAVSDTGTGMDHETLGHIFEPFFTTKPIGKGTGLGLATVFGIVKQSRGFVFAESEVGKGTTFKVYLPQVEVVETATTVRSPETSSGASETVLVVEDEPAFRDFLVEGLRGAGYRALAAENGVEALRTAEEHKGAINLVLTDVIMPQMSGPELVKCLKQVHPEISILYMSGYADDKLQGDSVSDGLALIQKPFYLQDLLRKIKETLSRHESRQPGIQVQKTSIIESPPRPN